MRDLFYEQLWDHKAHPTCFSVSNNGNPAHFHSSLEFVYVKKGSLMVTISGKQYTVSENQLIIIPSCDVHLFQTPDSADTYVLIIPISFIPSFEDLFKNKRFSQVIFDDPEYINEVAHCFDCLYQLMETRNYYMVKGYICILLGILIEKIGLTDISERKDYSQVQNILNFIQENFINNITLSSISKQFGYSENGFSHFFNKNIGCSFPTYIGILRIKRAAYLIKEENMPIVEASMESGFESLRTFYRIFKQHFGVTPSQYIKLF